MHPSVNIDILTHTHTQVAARGRETLSRLLCLRTRLVTFTAVMLLFTAFIDTPTSGAACDYDHIHKHTHTVDNVDILIQRSADMVLIQCVISHFTLCWAFGMPVVWTVIRRSSQEIFILI